MEFTWSSEKNILLKKNRNISFEDILQALGCGDLLDVIPSPTHKGQSCFVVQIKEYVYIVPFVKEDEKTIFLKTIYPSRKHTKYYLKEKR